jgi:flagellar hook protein FlgE
MMRGMYAAISGLEVHQTMLDVTANNLANVDTIGYKGQRATFVDELSQMLRGASAPSASNGGSNAEQVGLGVQLGSIDNLMAAGSLQSTGNPLDVAIQGDGFLRVGAGAPPATPPYTSGLPASFEYTRAGNLTTNTQGFLTTQNGLYVIGRNAVPAGTAPNITYSPGTSDTYLNVPPGSTNVAIGQDGSVTYTDENPSSPTYQQSVTAGYLSLATFPNEAGLERAGGSMWNASASSGTPTVGTPNTGGFGQTISGTLEMSNVDMAAEFTNMITAERGYQANSRVITTADQMLQTVVQIGQ